MLLIIGAIVGGRVVSALSANVHVPSVTPVLRGGTD